VLKREENMYERQSVTLIASSNQMMVNVVESG